MLNRSVIGYGSYKINRDELHKCIAPEWVEWLRKKEEEETRIRDERNILHNRLELQMSLVSQLETNPIHTTEAGFRKRDRMLRAETLRLQQAVEKLVRVGTKLLRTRIELNRKEMELFKEYLLKKDKTKSLEGKADRNPSADNDAPEPAENPAAEHPPVFYMDNY